LSKSDKISSARLILVYLVTGFSGLFQQRDHSGGNSETAVAMPCSTKSKKAEATAELPVQPMALSIRAFARAHGISCDTYYRMQRQGLGPATMKVGSRTLISVEAAAAWRREREADTNANTVAAK
jgi:hypothetical protein